MATTIKFTKAIAETLYNSSEEFPVSFNKYWHCLGHTRKDNAKRSFLNSDLEEGVDFCILTSEGMANFKGSSDFESDILMTIDALKDWGMQSKTSEGKQIRKYFIEVEKSAREFAKNWKSDSESFKIADKAIAQLKKLEKSNPVTYQMALKSLGVDSDLAETSSLVANRLGLAFNKQIKAFEAIQDATSPEAFNDLREAYYKLAEDFQQLMKVKTPPIQVEKIEVPVEKIVIQKEIVRVESDYWENQFNDLSTKYYELQKVHEELRREYVNQLSSTKLLKGF